LTSWELRSQRLGLDSASLSVRVEETVSESLPPIVLIIRN